MGHAGRQWYGGSGSVHIVSSCCGNFPCSKMPPRNTNSAAAWIDKELFLYLQGWASAREEALHSDWMRWRGLLTISISHFPCQFLMALSENDRIYLIIGNIVNSFFAVVPWFSAEMWTRSPQTTFHRNPFLNLLLTKAALKSSYPKSWASDGKKKGPLSGLD